MFKHFSKIKIIFASLLLFAVTGCTGSGLNNSGSLFSKTAEPGTGKGCSKSESIKVLFIGNSYISANSLPALLEQMACSLGYKIEHDSYTPGGAWFKNHKDDPATLVKINSENWDFVVLQNQSQAPGWKPVDVKIQSLPNAQTLVNQIKANNAQSKIIYCATWARQHGDSQNCNYYSRVCTFTGHTAALKEGYDIYQTSTGGLIAPVGTYWQFIVQDSKVNRPFDANNLWSEDGGHPSLIGSYLAAAAILKQIISAPVSSSDFTAGLDSETASYILSVVDSL